MNKFWRYLFILLIVVFLYHLVRDVYQILGIHSWLVDLWHRPHEWCGLYCNYVTIFPELFVIIASVIVLKRGRVGMLGVIILVSLLFWPLAAFLP